MGLGVVTAVKPELRPTLAVLKASPRRFGRRTFYEAGPLAFVAGGVGARRAEEAACLLIENFRPSALLSAGFAGSLVPGLSTGDLVLGGSSGLAASEDLVRLATRAAPEARVAEVVMIDRVVVSAAEKEALSGRSGALAVDMESAAVGRAAADRGLGFLCVKAILDTPEKPLASRYESVGRVLREILRRPSLLSRIFADGARARQAAGRLAVFFQALSRALSAS